MLIFFMTDTSLECTRIANISDDNLQEIVHTILSGEYSNIPVPVQRLLLEMSKDDSSVTKPDRLVSIKNFILDYLSHQLTVSAEGTVSLKSFQEN